MPEPKPLELLDFQKEAQKFVLNRKASILSLATGLGKTITSISAVERVINKYPKAKCIYVTEDSILPQSVEDIREHFNLNVVQIYKLRPKERTGAFKEFVNSGHILVLNYHILIREIDRLIAMILQEKLQVVSIFDEANNIRNLTSKFHQASKKLSHISYKAIALTATPSKQKINDIYNTLVAIGVRICNLDTFSKYFEIITNTPVLQIYNRGKLITQVESYGGNNYYKTFRFKLPNTNPTNVVKPAKGKIKFTKSGMFEYGQTVSNYSKQIMLVDGEPYELHCFAKFDRVGFKNLKLFMEKTKPHMFVKSKRSVANLPRYTLFKHFVTEDKKSKELVTKIYQGLIKKETEAQVSDNTEKEQSSRVVVNYAQLLIAQNTPQVYDDTVPKDYITNKIREVLHIIENYVDENEKIVIYSPWRKSIDTLHRILLEQYYDYNSDKIAKISGGGDTDNNEERKRFQTNLECQCLLMTDAGTRGLNLQVANHIIFLNMPKDAGDYDQVGGRLPRVGSKHSSLNAYFIIAENTIDQDHYEMVMRNYIFMRSLHPEFGDETLQDNSQNKLSLSESDQFILGKMANRKKQYLK